MGQLEPTDAERLEFYHAVVGWSYRDVDVAILWLNEAEADFGDFADFLEQEADNTDDLISALDVCAKALEFICNQAILPHLAEYVAGNFTCSRFDIDSDKAAKIMRVIKKDDRNAAWRFLADTIGVKYTA
jgi:hypothetical protein